MMKRLLVVLTMVIGVIGGVLFLNLFIFVETPSGETEQSVVIEKGTPLEKIVEELASKGVISNIPLFKAYVLIRRASGKIHAGEYLFLPQLKPHQVLSLLMKGDFAIHRITLLEGWTAKEIAAYLGGLKLVDPKLFLMKCTNQDFIQSLGIDVSSLEGYLFPDTYELYKPKNEEEILRRLVGRFKEVYSQEFEARAREMGLSQREVMTLASIVEKETGAEEERPLVASVFLNRLKKWMPLASDPTIIYSLPHFSGNLTRQDLSRPSPYNTYQNIGLPPTPISNPGLKSIRAVLFPADTEYLYFVSKNDGTHYFSKTEMEHNMAVRKYQLGRP